MNDRFKFRIYDKGNEQYLNLSEVDYLTLDTENGGLIIGFLDELMTEMTYMPEKDIVVEMSTGLKDKNSNLIYEGDVVKSMIRTGYIKWNKGDMTWFVYVLKSNEIIALNGYLDGELEIIGNIHNQPGQKDK